MKRLFTKRKSSQSAPPAVSAPAPLPVTRPPALQPKYVVPPMTHPHPYSSIHVLVTAEGLKLRPDVQGLTDAPSHVRISWGKDGAVEEISGEPTDWTASTTVHGIIGILQLFNASYLLVITSRSPLGDLFDETRAVFRVDGVSAIPLEASRATTTVNMLASLSAPGVLKAPPAVDVNVTSSAELQSQSEGSKNLQIHVDVPSPPHVTFAQQEPKSVSSPDADELDIPMLPSPISSGSSTPISSLASSPMAKVLASRLSFWSRLSKRTSVVETPAALDGRPPSPATIDSFERRMKEGEDSAELLDTILAATAPPPPTAEEQHSELDDKIVRETIKEFVRGGMYFSYHCDITTSLQRKQQQIAKLKQQTMLLSDLQALEEQPPVSLSSTKADAFLEPQLTLPLWRRVDRKFWWNETLLRPFIDAGLHSYVLPIMQGYYQIASFYMESSVPTIPIVNGVNPNGDGTSELFDESKGHLIDYVVISRRSRERAGLRYQRRGIDDNANVANFVETETIMRIKREGRTNVFSFIQIRGSIPLFWTQTGYGLKPAPQLSVERTHDQSLDALKRHFERTVMTYGPVTVVNLAEQHGKEGHITAAYRKSVEELNLSDVRYYEYDFHAETKGMRYDNISKLIEQLGRTFESHGFLWVSDSVIMSQQKGVFRINCIDCLDRTNVVQSAFARYVLHNQLEAVAVLNSSEAGDRTEADIVFNDVWANNGDAISRAYAGTSALKGDFTRTGKRDLGGLLHDGLNSLSRVYTSTFSDWFSQAVIDFLLGNRTLSVFSEFLLKLSATDPRELIRISKIRAAAIESCASRVLFEGERQIGGWTLFSPLEMSTRLGDKFEEKVLLLTANALYIVSYDYSLEKVKQFTRIPLGDIVGITKGAYILSPLEEASRRTADNYGFVILYLPTRLTTRVTSYSMRNTVRTASAQSNTMRRLSQLSSVTSQGGTALSRILYGAVSSPGKLASTAFKALPVDHTPSAPADVEDAVGAALTCRDAVDVMVEMIRLACADVGSGTENDFVREKDVVSLAEAQRATTIYAKLEYNFKRLLWLGS